MHQHNERYFRSVVTKDALVVENVINHPRTPVRKTNNNSESYCVFCYTRILSFPYKFQIVQSLNRNDFIRGTNSRENPHHLKEKQSQTKFGINS